MCRRWCKVRVGSCKEQSQITRKFLEAHSQFCYRHHSFVAYNCGSPPERDDCRRESYEIENLDLAVMDSDSTGTLNSCIVGVGAVDDEVNRGSRCDSGYAGKEAGSLPHSNILATSVLRKKSDPMLMSNVRFGMLGRVLANLREVILGTKLAVLLPAIPLAIVAEIHGFGRAWIFALSLLGLIPLAERVSFLTEQIAYFTSPTVGGLLNATCGNATELIIAILALYRRKVDVVKYSLLGSVLSNLLLVLGSSLLCGGLANLNKEQRFDRANVNPLMLMLGLLCHVLPLMFRHGPGGRMLELSRASSIVMLVAYVAYIFFQLKTQRQSLESQQEEEEGKDEENAVIGFWSAFFWLAGMTAIIAILSEYVVGTIEAASSLWGISVSFIGVILLPIVGNAAEHAGSIIFALKNKLDISLGVALGSASQISMFVVPLCVIVSWIMGGRMDLDFSIIETGSFALAIIVTSIALQDGTSHYLKGLVLVLCYFVIAMAFFVKDIPFGESSISNLWGAKTDASASSIAN